MAIGPVQLIALGFNHPDFHGEIIAELERLRESDTVRVIDSLAVYKDEDGEIEVEHLSNLSTRRRSSSAARSAPSSASGSRARKACRRARRPAPRRPPRACTSSRTRRPGTSSRRSRTTRPPPCILLEHHWAVPLRDAIARAGGFRISDGFISPLDLVEIGLLSAEEAEELQAAEKTTAETGTVTANAHDKEGR